VKGCGGAARLRQLALRLCGGLRYVNGSTIQGVRIMTALTDTASAGLSRNSAPAPKLASVRIWLVIIAAFVLAMVVVGGATRLTGSGLSITEWKPIMGALPPMSETAWQDAFEKYKQIPQYEAVNKGFSLEGFKAIFWWEWSHRLLGRLVGFVFLLPFAYFLWRRAIPKPFIARVFALFVLGGAQGGMGWFMVASGLAGSDRIAVSQYRLAAHLALATIIAAYAFWLALTIREEGHNEKAAAGGASYPVKVAAIILSGLVYLQIIAGAFVAGLKGGLASNTWPLMNGEIVPAGMDQYSPLWMNLFENPLTAQFVHRIAAYVIALYAVVFAAAVWRRPALRGPAMAMIGATLLQIALGVLTILYDVPLSYALVHQGNAMLVLAASVWAMQRAVDPERKR
jgi:heme a synthase